MVGDTLNANEENEYYMINPNEVLAVSMEEYKKLLNSGDEKKVKLFWKINECPKMVKPNEPQVMVVATTPLLPNEGGCYDHIEMDGDVISEEKLSEIITDYIEQINNKISDDDNPTYEITFEVEEVELHKKDNDLRVYTTPYNTYKVEVDKIENTWEIKN